MNVFICYGNEDGEAAKGFASQLETLGYDVWYDTTLSDNIEWHIQILQRIRQCDVVILLITAQVNFKQLFRRFTDEPEEPSATTRPNHIDTQILYALDLGKTLVPVVLEPVDLDWLPTFLEELAFIPYYKMDLQSNDALKQALLTPPKVLSSGLYLDPSNQAALKNKLKYYLGDTYWNMYRSRNTAGINTYKASSENPIQAEEINRLLAERPPDEAAFNYQPDLISPRIFTCHTVVTSVAFSPDGCYVFARTGDGIIRMWNTITGQEILQRFIYPSSSFTFSRNDGWGYLTTWGFDVHVINVVTGKSDFKYVGHTNFTTSAAFSPDNKLVATASLDQTVRLWETDGKMICQFKACDGSIFSGSNTGVLSVVFSPDGKHLLTGARDRTVRIWDVKTASKVNQFIDHTSDVTSVAFSPDGRFILTGSLDHTVRIQASGIV